MNHYVVVITIITCDILQLNVSYSYISSGVSAEEKNEERKNRKMPTWNVSFFLYWMLILRIVLLLFALLCFDFHACQIHLWDAFILSPSQPKHTCTHTRTHMYGILEPSFSVTSMALTRITTTKKREIRGHTKATTCKISRSPFNDAQTNQPTNCECILTLNCEIRFEFVTSAQNIKHFLSAMVVVMVVVLLLFLFRFYLSLFLWVYSYCICVA